jgi:hypothetical protein
VKHTLLNTRNAAVIAAAATSLLSAVSASAQIPKINTFFPIGAKAGTTAEIEIRGSGLDGANMLLVHGKGLTGTLTPGGAKADETNKPVWQAKCGSCHELRSPANRSLTPGQWAATVERMVKARSAPLSADETTKVTQYLVSAARAGRVTAQITVAPDTVPGVYEVRVATPRGISSPYWFEVGNLPEVLAAGSTREQAQPVPIPCTVHGCFMASGERHFMKFSAKAGERLIFNLKAYRYNETNQFFFSPNLRLYDANGTQLVENHGYYDMDPLIDWQCPADGSYTLEVRDLLGRPNPSSVYRLTMGLLPYDNVAYPVAGQAGSAIAAAVIGKGSEQVNTKFTLPVPADTGVVNAPSPFGPLPFYSCASPVITAGPGVKPASVPAAFTGQIAKAGAQDVFPVAPATTGVYEFEGYATRLSSPMSISAAITKADGSAIATFGGDGRMTARLEAGQNYFLKVSSGNGVVGPNCVYAIEARHAGPGLDAVLRPDNITIRPGVSTAAMVILTRRDGVDGAVTVSAEDLPAGVTVTPVVLAPDRNTAWLQFNAAANAAPVEKPVRVTVSGHGPFGDRKSYAIPQEEYRLNNDPRYRNWSDATVAVRGQSDFSLAFVDPRSPILVHPRKATPVKVKVTRRPGFTGSVTVYLSGLPLGWVAGPEATTGNEVTLTVRPDGNNTQPFLTRDVKWAPVLTTLEGASDDFRFAFGTIEVKRVAVISDKDD